MDDLSDAELLVKWLEQRSEQAFDLLVRRYAGLVYHAALRVGRDANLATEASQLTFITLARKAGTLACRDSLAGWLHVTGAMQARNLLQLAKRENRKRDELGQHLNAVNSEDNPQTIWKTLEPVLDEALAALSHADRHTILLRHYRSLSIREIATALSISVDAAQKRLDRAMERLRLQLTRRGCAPAAGLAAGLTHGLASNAEASLAAASSLSAPIVTALRATPKGVDDFNGQGDYLVSYTLVSSGGTPAGVPVKAGSMLYRKSTGQFTDVDPSHESSHHLEMGEGGHIVGFRQELGHGHRYSTYDWGSNTWVTNPDYTEIAIAVAPGGGVRQVPHPAGSDYGWEMVNNQVVRDNEAWLYGVNSHGLAVGRATSRTSWGSLETYSFYYDFNSNTSTRMEVESGWSPQGASSINDLGEVAGINGDTSWIYLPAANYGMSAGYHVIRNEDSSYSQLPKITNLGQVFWCFRGNISDEFSRTFWDQGSLRNIQDLLPADLDWSVNCIMDFNHFGKILVGGDDYSTYVLNPLYFNLHIEPGGKLKVGQDFTAKVTMGHALPEPATYSFTGEIISWSPADAVEMRETELPGEIILNAETPNAEFAVPGKALKPGYVTFTSQIQVTDENNLTQVFDLTKEVLVDPLKVDICITRQKHLLNQTPEATWGPRAKALNAARRANDNPETEEDDPYTNLIEIEMVVTNKCAEQISSVNVPDVRDILSYIQSLETEDPGVPLTPIRLYGPNGAEVDLTNPGDTTAINSVNLAPDQSVTFAWVLDAFDANEDPAVDDTTSLEFTPMILGALRGRTLTTVARTEFAVIERPLLEWGVSPKDGRVNYMSGQVVRVNGYIENISAKDGKPPEDLRVMVYQLPEGNLGGGFMFDPTTSGGNQTQLYYAHFDLPAEGPESIMNLEAVFRSFPTVKASSGKVKYGVRVWTLEDVPTGPNGTRRAVGEASEQALIKEGWLEEFNVEFAADRPAFTRLDECHALQEVMPEIAGILPFLCGVEEGLTIDLTDGIIGLGKFAWNSGETLLNAGTGMMIWELKTINNVWKAVQNDPAAKNALMQEAYVAYRTYVELGMMAGEAGTNVPAAFEDFSVRTLGAMTEFLYCIETGKADDVEYSIGKFLGANPDMVFEPLVVARNYQMMSRALLKIENSVVDNTVEAAIRAEKERLANSLDDRIADAMANGRAPETGFRPGDIISDPKLYDIFGITKKQKERIQQIAQDNGIIINFRSRNPISIKLIDDGLAYPKPQSLKHKTVNKIDMDYLGYRRSAHGKLEMVEPKAGLLEPNGRALEGTALEDAVELELDALGLTNNPVLRKEVGERMKLRAEEWNKLFFDKLDTTKPGVINQKITSAFEADLQFAAKERDKISKVGAVEQRTVSYEPVPGSNPRTWEMKMTGPNGAAAKYVTGDIDFMSILDEYGCMIRDPQKRIQIYTQLATVLDMQHGESFTFFLQKAREGYLKDHVFGTPDAEAMVSISGLKGGTPRAAFFVDNLSIMDNPGCPNAKWLPKRKPLSNPIVDFVLRRGEPKFVRRADPTGEFVLLDGMQITTKPQLDLVNRIIPITMEDALLEFLTSPQFILPSLLIRMNFEEPFPAVNFTESANGAVLQSFEKEDGEFTLKTWTEANGWQEITPQQALALGDPNVLELSPMTLLPEGGSPGEVHLANASQTAVGVNGDFFSVGDRVVLNPGQTNQEITTVRALGSLIFASGLRHGHQPGEMVASLGPDTTDRDGDTLSGLDEIALGTDPDNSDTDADGLPDNIELSKGFSPLDGASGFGVTSFSAPAAGGNGNITITWIGYQGNTYEIQGTENPAGEWDLIDEVTAGPGLIQSYTFGNPYGRTGFFRVYYRPPVGP